MVPIKIIEVIKRGAQGIPGITDHPEQTGFFAYSDDTMLLSEDGNNPSYMTGFVFDSDGNFTLTDANTGAIRNDSGRVLNMSGTFSYTPIIVGGGGSRTVHIVSESSVDGINWTPFPGSHRPVDVSNSITSFKTTVSFVLNWPVGAYGRFRMFTTGGQVQLQPTSVAALGTTIAGRSVIFELSETFREQP